MAKVKQKVSAGGRGRNIDYAHAYCRIFSYLQTMANKGHNPLIAIQMVFSKDTGGEQLPNALKKSKQLFSSKIWWPFFKKGLNPFKGILACT